MYEWLLLLVRRSRTPRVQTRAFCSKTATRAKTTRQKRGGGEEKTRKEEQRDPDISRYMSLCMPRFLKAGGGAKTRSTSYLKQLINQVSK